MATIHKGTTLVPGKLELLGGWLPLQPWYADAGRPPELTRAGGFRLDDPAGDVGIEFLFVTDTAGQEPTTYSVPMTYRGAPLTGPEQGLIGTAEHGVLGRRWIYDAAHDPVALATLVDFLCGRTDAQAQSETDTLDPSVGRVWASSGRPASSGALRVSNAAADRTTVDLTTDDPALDLSLDVVRVLRSGRDGTPDGADGCVTADWQRLDGSTARGPVVVVRALQQ